MGRKEVLANCPELDVCPFDDGYGCDQYKYNKCYNDYIEGRDMTDWDSCPYDGLYGVAEDYL